MKVKVIPKKPIPGILPKNKWIDMEMELDLNKSEITHCMQFGSVYDENGKLIDSLSIKSIPTSIIPNRVKPVKKVVIEENIITTVETVGEPIKIDMSKYERPEVTYINAHTDEVIKEEPIVEEIIEVEPSWPETSKEYFILDKVSVKKEEDYIILEVESNSNYTLEGNLYGLLSVISGTRPTPFEFKVGGEWFKFNNKFANFSAIENGAKFVFRFSPKSENEFTVRIVIKEANNELARLEEKINPVTI